MGADERTGSSLTVIHKHLIVRAEVARPFVEVTVAEAWLRNLVSEIGMVITNHGGPHVDYVEKEGNCGIAGIVMIETSHCSLHIWDKQEPPLVQLDVYSCADYDHNIVLGLLEEMEPTKLDWILLDRENMSLSHGGRGLVGSEARLDIT